MKTFNEQQTTYNKQLAPPPMTPTQAQTLTLTAYGNHYLAQGALPTDFYPANTSFQFCNHIDFRAFRAASAGATPVDTVLVEDPIAWLQYLKKDGCQKLRLFHKHSGSQGFTPEAQLAGLTDGAGVWMIEAIYDGWSNYWSSHWEITQPTAPDHRIWSVTYRMTLEQQPVCNLQIDVAALRGTLKETLTQIALVAGRKQFDDWCELFRNASAILEAEQPQHYYYLSDLIPTDYASLAARQVLFTALAVSVFDRDGAWSDGIWAKDEEDHLYNQLSGGLFESIHQAVIAAINAG